MGFAVKSGAFKIYPRVAGGQIRNKYVIREKVVERLAAETVHGNICQRTMFTICWSGIIIQAFDSDMLGKIVPPTDPQYKGGIKICATIKNIAADQGGNRKAPLINRSKSGSCRYNQG